MVGGVFRDEAKSRGFDDIKDFCKYDTLNDFYDSTPFKVLEEIDMHVDENFRKLAKRGGVVIESKTFAALATKENIPCTAKIWITADLEVRISRFMLKNDIGWLGRILQRSKVRGMLSERYAMDMKRYARLYDIDYGNPQLYNDLVIDNSDQDVEETFNLVIKHLENAKTK